MNGAVRGLFPMGAVLVVASCMVIGQPHGDGLDDPDAFDVCRPAIEEQLSGEADFDGGSEDRDLVQGTALVTGSVTSGGDQYRYACRVAGGAVIDLLLEPA